MGILRDVLVIGGVAIGIATAAANRDVIYDYLGMTQEAESPPPQDTSKKPVQQLSGQAVAIPKSKLDGQFWTDARVNGGHVNFLVDTGASTVALTLEDARHAGIKLNMLKYDVPISTAGGQNMAAHVTLKSVSIGTITLRDVKALVVPEGLSKSLLGMTFLGDLQKVEATPQTLILRL